MYFFSYFRLCRRLIFLVFINCCLFCLDTHDSAYAAGFNFMNAKAMGMGGAYCALAESAGAPYWNPAGLAFRKSYGLTFETSEFQRTQPHIESRLEDAYSLPPMDETVYDDAEATETLVRRLKDLNDIDIGAVRSKTMTFSILSAGGAMIVREIDELWFRPIIDLENIESAPPEEENSIADNDSRIEFTGIKGTEFDISFSNLHPEAKAAWGVTVKYVTGKTYRHSRSIWNLDSENDSDELLDRVDRYEEQQDEYWSADMGLILFMGNGRLGFVGHDVFRPKLERKNEEAIEIAPSYRIGFSQSFSRNFLMAVDYDLTKNKYENEYAGKKHISFGLQKWFGNRKKFGLRAGLLRDFEADENEIVYTTGLGIMTKIVEGNVGIAFDNEKNQFGWSFDLKIDF